MKINTLLVILAVQLAAVNAGSQVAGTQVAARMTVEEECGALGVFKPTNVPDNVNTTVIRKCAEHPESLKGITAGPDSAFIHDKELAEIAGTSPVARDESASPLLLPRACLHDDEPAYGCSVGKWCWYTDAVPLHVRCKQAANKKVVPGAKGKEAEDHDYGNSRV
ncbi:hypothetical protein EsH8_VII_000151 [Colletotrichum jinshuiense]